MSAEITLDVWETPSDYGGYDPVGHYGVLAQHRDSDAVARSNWLIACQRLAEIAGVPVEDLAYAGGWDAGVEKAPGVYHWRAGHWAVGWVEYLMVRPDAPQAVLEAAQAIKDEIAEYPILDEDHFSKLEWTERCDYWASMSVRHRATVIKDSGCDVSLFAARRDELPRDDSGRLEEWLR